MRIRIDIDITPTELAGWLESIVAAPVSTTPESTEIDRLRAEVARLEGEEDDEWPDWPDDIDFDLFDEAAPEDSLATESRALDSLIAWAKGRKGGGHA
ncbi:hypothetical protein [Magnetospirillum aberrantis]|uniref:Uncharacterized protein n=1 Tax=Magnetospirillum aberrantis SpK TaxID=908842 RepID=A0A7C9QTG3_9PROT|nr:hypothetical protein [Magnetospirillum aberrantis]NFV78996.1 hypothetical protein [Magnetospirillum aberrantis SpK]